MKKTFYFVAVALFLAFLGFAIKGSMAAIHVALLGGAGLCFWYASIQRNSGTIEGGSSSNPKIVDVKGKLPFLKIHHTWFGIGLVIAEIAVIIASIAAK